MNKVAIDRIIFLRSELETDSEALNAAKLFFEKSDDFFDDKIVRVYYTEEYDFVSIEWEMGNIFCVLEIYDDNNIEMDYEGDETVFFYEQFDNFDDILKQIRLIPIS